MGMFIAVAGVVYVGNAPTVGTTTTIPNELFQQQMRKTQLAVSPSKVVVNAGQMSAPVKAITISIPKQSTNLQKVVTQMDGLKDSVRKLNTVLSSAGTSSKDADSIQNQASALQKTLTSVKAVTGGVATGRLIDSISSTAKQIQDQEA